MDAGAGGCVCRQVKLPGVMNPLQSLDTHTHICLTLFRIRVCPLPLNKPHRSHQVSRFLALDVFGVPVWRCVQTPRTADTGPVAASSWSRNAELCFPAAAARSGCLNTKQAGMISVEMFYSATDWLNLKDFRSSVNYFTVYTYPHMTST